MISRLLIGILARRQQGYGRRGMQIERDEVQILTGPGTALPSAVPLLLQIINRDHVNWAEREHQP